MLPSPEEIQNESDVEQKVIYPILVEKLSFYYVGDSTGADSSVRQTA